MKIILKFMLLPFIFVVLLSACATLTGAKSNPTVPPAATPDIQPSVTLREAQVTSVEIQVSQAEPVQVNAVVRGNLSESCASLVAPQITYASGTFQIKIMAQSPNDRGCAQVITPFDQTIPLDVSGLSADSYTVIANGVSAVFTLPGETSQPGATIHLVVESYDRSVRVVDANVPLKTTPNTSFNNFLPAGGSALGIAYVIDPTNPDALAIGSTGPQVIEFIQSPAIYGLAVWPGTASLQPRLAWGTEVSGLSQSSAIKVSNLDGSGLDTLLTQDAPNPATQLVPEFWSADGRSLYFSKEPLGIGGNILFGGGSSLFKLDVATKAVTELIPLGPDTGPQACLDAISADFRYVADHCLQNTIIVRDLVNGTSSPIQPPADVTDYLFAGGARFSPSGNHLAYALARTDQDNEQGWVALTSLNGGSQVILTSQIGIIYSLVDWLDDDTLLVQSINTHECIPDCATELWALKIDGTPATKLGEGRFLALIAGDLKPVPPPTGEIPRPATCQDAAEYVKDDGMSGANYPANTAFTKRWTVKNSGTCTWDSTYLVYQVSGAFMTQQPGYFLVPPGQAVEPGQTMDVLVAMTTPPTAGTYQTYWSLKNGAGVIMPIKGGADGNSLFDEIVVKSGSAGTGAVTATAIDIVPEQGSGDACSADATYFVHAYISTDGAATVSYEIGSSAGQISAGYFEDAGSLSPYVTGTLEFEQADDKQVNLRFVGPYPYPDDISVMLRVNGGEWVTTRLFCP